MLSSRVDTYRHHLTGSMSTCRMMALMGVIAGLLSLTLPVSAFASDDVFVVPRVPVAAQAESAIAAKQKAELEGRRQAMDLLLRRLVAAEDWDYLPKLARGEAAPLDNNFDPVANPFNTPTSTEPDYGTQTSAAQGFGQQRPTKQAISLTDQQLRELEQSFEVYDEKSGPTTYRAFTTYRFKPAEIRNLLITAGIPYSEAQTRIALVLPVLETDNGLYLWERNNPWLKVWQDRPLGYELTPMMAPLGDLEDSAALTAKEAMALSSEKFEALATRYGVSQIIVAHARLTQKNGEDMLRVRLINGYRESGALSVDDDVYSRSDALNGLAEGAQDRLDDINSAGTSLSGEVRRESPQSSVAEEVGAVLSESWLKQPSGNFPALADRSIVSSVNKYAAGWKAQTLIDHSSATILRASAFFQSIGEWKRIRAALISTPLVGSVQIRNLSREGAEMSIQTFGDPGKLVVALESQGVSLWTFHQGSLDGAVWNIATPATASRIPARVQRALSDGQRFERRSDTGFNNNEAGSAYAGAQGEGDVPFADRSSAYDLGEQTPQPTRYDPANQVDPGAGEQQPVTTQAPKVRSPYN